MSNKSFTTRSLHFGLYFFCTKKANLHVKQGITKKNKNDFSPMKGFFITIIVIQCVTATLQAQEVKSEANKKFGFKLGVNYSNMIFSKQFPTPETSGKVVSKTGILVGFILHTSLGKKLSLQTEYLISTRKAEVTTSGRHYKFTYLSFPVLLKYPATKRLSILAGPQADMLIYSSHQTNGTSIDLEHETEERNINALFGLEYKISKPFSVGVEYLKSLGDIGIENGSTEFKYEILQVSLAFNF
jgi:hypothetical protein